MNPVEIDNKKMGKVDGLTSPKPTIIITGFLGSGKTSYLNYLLEESPDSRYAIIENEYGKESIDGDVIVSEENDIIELNNGCLCCTLNDNLYDILNKLYFRREEFDQLIIEATGMADPRGLAAPFMTNPSVKKQFPLHSIVCLVDAELIEDQLEETEEAIHQITYSDVLLINKIDLVSKEYLMILTELMKKLNPLAKIITGSKGKFSIPTFISKSTNEEENLNDKLDVNNEFPITKPKHHHHHSHSDVVTHTFKFDKPFDLQKLQFRLMTFLMFQSHDLYRMKGLISISQSDSLHLVQSVGKRFSIDKLKKGNNNNLSTIIIIGKNVKRAGFENMFLQCQ